MLKILIVAVCRVCVSLWRGDGREVWKKSDISQMPSVTKVLWEISYSKNSLESRKLSITFISFSLLQHFAEHVFKRADCIFYTTLLYCREIEGQILFKKGEGRDWLRYFVLSSLIMRLSHCPGFYATHFHRKSQRLDWMLRFPALFSFLPREGHMHIPMTSCLFLNMKAYKIN